jgi:ParB family chromosome partitioning protein
MAEFNMNAFLSNANAVKQIPIDDLLPYSKHFFKLYDGERLDDMVESVRKNAILTPIIVRPTADGKYEILSGHNRTNAAKAAELTAVPAIVKESLSDIEAEVYVIETNLLQRGFSDLSISEQAAAVAVEYRAERLFNKEKREEIRKAIFEDENLSPVETKTDVFLDTGKKYSLSRAAVARLLRINKLPFQFQCCIDDGSLSIRAGVELSYINSGDLARIIGICYDEEGNTVHKINLETARRLRHVLTNPERRDWLIDLEFIITENSTAKTENKSIKINKQIYNHYFDKTATKDEVNDIIAEALKLYFETKGKAARNV